MRRRQFAALVVGTLAVACLILAYRLLAPGRPARPPLPPGAPVSPGGMRPEQFEARLRANPDDTQARVAAMDWYSHNELNYARLREETLQLVDRAPNTPLIAFDNEAAFYAVPGYRWEVIHAFQKQLARGCDGLEIYSNLGIICCDGALPGPPPGPERQKLLKYLELPANTQLPSHVDPILFNLSLRYFRLGYREALAGVSGYTHLANFVGGEGKLLGAVGRAGEVVPLYKQALPKIRASERADFLVKYGRCLREVGDIPGARRILGQVRAVDMEGNRGGPAHATTAADTELGLIALKQGNIKSARRYLLESAEVQTCPHNTTQGLPLSLAEALLGAGQRDAVITYCNTALGKFTPGQAAMLELRARAERGKGMRDGG